MSEEKPLTREQARDTCREVVDRLVGQHLKLETTPLSFEDRVDILYDTQPEEFNLAETKIMLAVAVAMLVAEREKKK